VVTADTGAATKKPRVSKIEKVEAVPHQQVGSGTYLEPIDVDAYRVSIRFFWVFRQSFIGFQVERTITFQPANPNRIYGKEITMFSPTGEKVNWIPEFHVSGPSHLHLSSLLIVPPVCE
jgi:hypothetical protein